MKFHSGMNFISVRVTASSFHAGMKFHAGMSFMSATCNRPLKQVFQYIKEPLQHVFNLSLTKGIVPDDLKIAKITPIFKSGEQTCVSNYRPISVLPCFSKILERIMYNRLYHHLIENNLLYHKQFGFQKNNSTEHAILELVDQLCNSFNNNDW